MFWLLDPLLQMSYPGTPRRACPLILLTNSSNPRSHGNGHAGNEAEFFALLTMIFFVYLIQNLLFDGIFASSVVRVPILQLNHLLLMSLLRLTSHLGLLLVPIDPRKSITVLTWTNHDDSIGTKRR